MGASSSAINPMQDFLAKMGGGRLFEVGASAVKYGIIYMDVSLPSLLIESTDTMIMIATLCESLVCSLLQAEYEKQILELCAQDESDDTCIKLLRLLKQPGVQPNIYNKVVLLK